MFSVQSTGGYCKECGVFSVQRVACLRYHTQAYSVQMYNVQMYNVQVYSVHMYNVQMYSAASVFSLGPLVFPVSP